VKEPRTNCRGCDVQNSVFDGRKNLLKTCINFRDRMGCSRHMGVNWMDDCWHPIGTVLVAEEQDEYL